MRRREFFATLGGAAVALPLGARAQQQLRHVGFLVGTADDSEAEARVGIFRESLASAGWQDGNNVTIELRYTRADPDVAARFAAELLSTKPDVIATHTTLSTAAVCRLTKSTPVVFTVVSDPVGEGWVQSLSRPGGNVTGFINFESSIGGKWVELLLEIAPKTTKVAFIFNPATAPRAGRYFGDTFQEAAASLGLQHVMMAVSSKADIERNMADFAAPGAGLVVSSDIFTAVQRKPIIESAARYGVPAVYNSRLFATDGGLLSFGSSVRDDFARCGTYVARILAGAAPADLPVQVPVHYELVVNTKTAKALALDVPAALLARADEVIE